jgi:predicted metal-dependent hydrolase
MEMAQVIFEDMVIRHSEKIGVSVGEVVTRNLRNRWGSLTKNDVVNLNVDLLKAPENVIDYIIIQLCHLKIKEHCSQYWDLVHKFVPNS